jgi:DNA recombination protein RmuC
MTELPISIDPVLLGLAIVAITAILVIVVLIRQKPVDFQEIKNLVLEEHRQLREAATRDAWENREELLSAQSTAQQTLITSVAELGRIQREAIKDLENRVLHLAERGDDQQDRLRETITQQFTALQQSNEKQLLEMRTIVEEKLHRTLEQRLGSSFQQVADQLSAVQKGLGEMQKLAGGVGDLQRVLTNVKTRGTWGEVQLGALLEDALGVGQYERNVQTRKNSQNTVEYAVRLPGQDDDSIWLPIDAKFPIEDYQRLLDASEAADSAAEEQHLKALLAAIRKSAQEIAEKYVEPPYTTDFAILFLPTEGLYAEVLRQPGLVAQLQTEHRIVVAGPTTLAAMLNSLRLGFKTLAIQQRSSEVWRLLAGVKTEFDQFGGQLDKLKKQLDSASRTVDQTGTRTRAMARKLRDVEQLPGQTTTDLFADEDHIS